MARLPGMRPGRRTDLDPKLPEAARRVAITRFRLVRRGSAGDTIRMRPDLDDRIREGLGRSKRLATPSRA